MRSRGTGDASADPAIGQSTYRYRADVERRNRRRSHVRVREGGRRQLERKAQTVSAAHKGRGTLTHMSAHMLPAPRAPPPRPRAVRHRMRQLRPRRRPRRACLLATPRPRRLASRVYSAAQQQHQQAVTRHAGIPAAEVGATSGRCWGLHAAAVAGTLAPHLCHPAHAAGAWSPQGAALPHCCSSALESVPGLGAAGRPLRPQTQWPRITAHGAGGGTLGDAWRPQPPPRAAPTPSPLPETPPPR